MIIKNITLEGVTVPVEYQKSENNNGNKNNKDKENISNKNKENESKNFKRTNTTVTTGSSKEVKDISESLIPYRIECFLDSSETGGNFILDINNGKYFFDWKICVFSTETIGFVKDTTKEDREKALIESWEHKQPGRSEKANMTRNKFLEKQKSSFETFIKINSKNIRGSSNIPNIGNSIRNEKPQLSINSSYNIQSNLLQNKKTTKLIKDMLQEKTQNGYLDNNLSSNILCKDDIDESNFTLSKDLINSNTNSITNPFKFSEHKKNNSVCIHSVNFENNNFLIINNNPSNNDNLSKIQTHSNNSSLVENTLINQINRINFIKNNNNENSISNNKRYGNINNHNNINNNFSKIQKESKLPQFESPVNPHHKPNLSSSMQNSFLNSTCNPSYFSQLNCNFNNSLNSVSISNKPNTTIYNNFANNYNLNNKNAILKTISERNDDKSLYLGKEKINLNNFNPYVLKEMKITQEKFYDLIHQKNILSQNYLKKEEKNKTFYGSVYNSSRDMHLKETNSSSLFEENNKNYKNDNDSNNHKSSDFNINDLAKKLKVANDYYNSFYVFNSSKKIPCDISANENYLDNKAHVSSYIKNFLDEAHELPTIKIHEANKDKECRIHFRSRFIIQ